MLDIREWSFGDLPESAEPGGETWLATLLMYTASIAIWMLVLVGMVAGLAFLF